MKSGDKRKSYTEVTSKFHCGMFDRITPQLIICLSDARGVIELC